MDQRYLTRIALKTYQGLVSSTTTIWQCLPFSSTTLRGKQCQHPIAVMGVVDNANTSQLVSPHSGDLRDHVVYETVAIV